MKEKTTITVLVICIAILSSIATSIGIFSNGGPGPSTITSLRGRDVQLYGKGLYHDMSAEVAPQGIAQDVVTLFAGIPMLIIGLILFRRGSLKGRVVLTGVLGYFLTTYFFFTLMAMYNQLFLLWVVILSFCFHGFFVMFSGLDENEVWENINPRFPSKSLGGFLIFCAVSIGLLWLSIVVPPALKGTIPVQVEHYTTLVVQALDLSIGLPAACLAGIMIIKERAFGFKLASVYIIFLSILMTALSAKVVAMASLGYPVIPVVFIIPTFNVVSIFFAVQTVRNINEPID